jgi:hypothetical protein
MEFPRIQILTDFNSFVNIFDIEGLGSWRGYSAEAVHIISSLTKAGLRNHILIYDFSDIPNNISNNPGIALAQKNLSLFFDTKSLSFYDRYSISQIGRVIEFNNLSLIQNKEKSQKLKRICVNISEENQIIQILGILTFSYSENRGDLGKKFDHAIRWPLEIKPPIKNLIMADNYFPLSKVGTSKQELINHICKEFSRLIRLVVKDFENLNELEFTYLTKKINLEYKKNTTEQLNTINLLLCQIQDKKEIENLLNQELSGILSHVKIELSDKWHHRKIFSDYFMIFSDNTVIKNETSYSIQGLLLNYSAYYTNLQEANRAFKKSLDNFVNSNGLLSTFLNSKTISH